MTEYIVHGDGGSRYETHVCDWKYEPRLLRGEAQPRWRCTKQWSDGSRCRAEVDNPAAVVRPAYPPAPPPPAPDDDDPAYRVERHTCAWEYVPIHVLGTEQPLWQCAKRWSDGTRCAAMTVHSNQITESSRAVRVPAKSRSLAVSPFRDEGQKCPTCGCPVEFHRELGCAGDFGYCQCVRSRAELEAALSADKPQP